MEIEISSNIIKIDGNIKSLKNFQTIKQNLDSLTQTNKNIIIELKNSLSITSSVIGYINELVLKDNINIQIHVANQQLLNLLTDLKLNTKKISK
jgi:hypothetical protein